MIKKVKRLELAPLPSNTISHHRHRTPTATTIPLAIILHRQEEHEATAASYLHQFPSTNSSPSDSLAELNSSSSTGGLYSSLSSKPTFFLPFLFAFRGIGTEPINEDAIVSKPIAFILVLLFSILFILCFSYFVAFIREEMINLLFMFLYTCLISSYPLVATISNRKGNPK
ncbi:hypothetical protein Lser_V15G27290 [Lactuca serriola]